jgi:hypothetical protein
VVPSGLLIRRDAERTLGLATTWFLAIPILVVGYLAIIWPLGYLLPHDCFSPPCPTEGPLNLIPPFLVPAAVLLVVAVVGASVLRRVADRRPAIGWPVVAFVGSVLIASSAVLVIVNGGRAEVALLAFVWPFTPGLLAVDAAWRSRGRRPTS